MPLSRIHDGLLPRACVPTKDTNSATATAQSSSSGGTPKQIDCSTLVLSYASTPAAVAGATTSLAQNYASTTVAWSDVFDVQAAPCDAWWLRNTCTDDASELCVSDVEQLRSMSGRLARAAQLAASGSKWGLLKAVLLSWDSAPASPQNWVRQQIALEACSLLILPAAAQGLGADLQGAWEQLPGKEQQLWCQLQQARLAHSRRDARMAVATHYTIDRPSIAALLQRATGVAEAGVLLAEPAFHMGMDMEALNMFPTAAVRRRNMDASYTALLLCCRVYGHAHPRTQAALADTRVTDPDGWVPVLLAGLAYPSLTRSPGVVQGSKEEATAYVHNYGAAWAESSGTSAETFMAVYGPHLTWMLQQRGKLPALPSREQQADLRALRLFSCGQFPQACKAVKPIMAQVMEKIWSLGEREAIKQVGEVHVLRYSLILLGSIAQVTYNLPPLDVAPQCWQAVLEVMRAGEPRVDMSVLNFLLLTCLEGVPNSAAELIHDCKQQQLRPSGFWRPTELTGMQAFFEELSSSFCRVFWQLGCVDKAQSLAQQQLAEQECLGPKGAALQPGSAPWAAIAAFLTNQRQGGQVAAAGRDAGGAHNTQHNSTRCSTGASSSSSSTSSTRGVAAGPSGRGKQAGATRQMAFFASFPGWVDRLVSQVVGRPVTLAIDVQQPYGMHPLTMPTSTKPHAEVFLVEADGSKVPFSWQARPSGANHHPNTTDTSSSSIQAASAALAAGSLPAEDIYAKYLLPGVASSAHQLQAGRSTNWDSHRAAAGDVHTTNSTTSSSGPQANPSSVPAQPPGASRSKGDGIPHSAAARVVPAGSGSFLAAAAGSSSTSSSRPPPASSTRPTSSSCNFVVDGVSSGGLPVQLMTLDRLQDMAMGHRSGRREGEHDDDDDVDNSTNMLRDWGITPESLNAALRSLSCDSLLQGAFAAASQGGSSGAARQRTGSTQPAAAPASPARQAGGGHSGSRSVAAQQPAAASSAAPSAVTRGGSSGAAAAAPPAADTAGSGHSGDQGGGAAAGSSSAPPGGKKLPRPCAMCGQLFPKLQRCSRCKEVLYCSKEHQVAHWKLVHKLECKA